MSEIINNSKISFIAIIAIIISFTIVLMVLSIFESKVDTTVWQTNFFLNNQTFEENTIVILGSSQTATLNATYIENNLKSLNDFVVYNLSISADRPTKRIDSIDEIIKRQPALVVYGIGYIDFENAKKEKFNKPVSFLPDVSQYLEKFFSNEVFSDFAILSSPKFITLKNIRNMIEPNIINYYFDEKTPFFPYDLAKQTSIMNDENLQNFIYFQF